MTAEPLRDPASDPLDTPDVPPATAPDTAPIEHAPDASATTEAAASPPMDSDGPAIEAPAPATETTVANTVATTDALAAVAEAPPVVRPSRRPMVLAVLRRVLLFALTVVLFVAGATLGATTFQRTRPAPVGTDGAIAFTDPPPAVAQEFIAALGANDSDAMRSSLSEAPNKDLTNEFTRFDIKKVKSVDTLGTAVDGSRSATEILLHAEKSDGLPFEVNLVILVDGGTIEGFR
jgi:hypothetical protein